MAVNGLSFQSRKSRKIKPHEIWYVRHKYSLKTPEKNREGGVQVLSPGPCLSPSPPKLFHCHSTYSYMTTNNRYSIHKGVLPTRNVYMSWHFWIRYFAIFDTRRRSKSLLITLGLIRETSWRMRSLSDYLVGVLGFTLIVTGKSTELMTLITNP